MATYIKKATLEFSDIYKFFGMSSDNGGRWDATSKTQGYVVEYLSSYRTPSRSWPHSYSKALLSQKFAKLVCEKDPELAIKLGIATK